ncbi:ImmA/IrrE family metallo-endopeptidase [uncultured Ruegeria sp.]|uniref:ImmA/IrrE family metallo-endopeptidase n=1 Tax=uncultured Ruegeria sp. TaxID=259304 RepID=UPI00344C3444
MRWFRFADANNAPRIIPVGSANFSTRSIETYRNDDTNRERFTIAHETGHFCLKHDRYLRSERRCRK